MAEVAVAFIAKAVVGFAVGKLVGEITGNELLGAIAGGIAGGGLSFQTGSGFTWSLSGGGAAATTQAGVDLVNTVPGGSELLGGTAMDLFAEGAGNVDLLGGAAQMAGDVAVNNAGGAGNLFGGLMDGAAGGLFDSAAGGALDVTKSSGFFDNLLGGGSPLEKTVANATQAGGQTPTGGTLWANKAQPLNVGGQAVNQSSGSTGGFLDKAVGFMEKNPETTNILAKGVMNMMGPDAEEEARETYRDKLKADADFQTNGFTGTNQTPTAPGFKSLRDSYRQNSPLSDIQAKYSLMTSPNYQALIDQIRNRRLNPAQEAA